ncbi:MAG: hypothetical protein ACR2MC_06180 [Actinomycetota bacterium]
MGRKLVFMRDGQLEKLAEIRAENELELQELIKDDPDLLPIEEFGFDPPVMVVGRESRLKYGAADLVLLTRSGRPLVVEFKTGKGEPRLQTCAGSVARLRCPTGENDPCGVRERRCDRLLQGKSLSH